MEKKDLLLVDYLKSFSKMLKITAEYLRSLGELEEKDLDRFNKFKDMIASPEKLIELAGKKSPELSKLLFEMFATFGSISNIKNPMDLTAKEKQEQAEVFKTASERIDVLSKKIAVLIKKGVD